MRSIGIVVLAICLVVSAQPKIPGSDIVGVGYDGTTLEFRGLPIITYTWDASNTWTYPIYTDLTYLVPLEFYVASKVETLLVDSTIVFSNISDYQEKEVHTTSKGGFLGFGKKSKTTYKYIRNYYEEDYSLSLSYQYHAWYEITLPPLPPPMLHPMTQAAITALPATYGGTGTPGFAAYRNFIDTFGTHYVTQAVMGGMAKCSSWYHKCMISQYGENWVKQQSGWSFLGIINHKSGDQNFKGNTTAQWNEYSAQEVQLRGGNGVLFQSNQQQSWINSIKNNPDAISYTVEPIYDLILDQSRKNSMQQAVTDYLLEAEKEGTQLVNSLSPFDPKTRPPWCTKSY